MGSVLDSTLITNDYQEAASVESSLQSGQPYRNSLVRLWLPKRVSIDAYCSRKERLFAATESDLESDFIFAEGIVATYVEVPLC